MNKYKYKRLLLSFIKPILKELERDDMLERVKALVKQHLKEVRDFIVEKSNDELFAEYSGEATDFGEDGWNITKKVFEYSSRTAIAKLDPEFRKGRKFQEKKLLHCFLNSLGYSFDNFEAMYHLDEFIGRMLILDKKRMVDAAMQKNTVEKRLSEWKNKKLEKI